MTIVNQSDVDKAMGRLIDPNSVPRHIGGSLGAMQKEINLGSEDIHSESGHGRRGSAIYDESGVGGQNFYGSQDIISLKEAPPLPAALAPKPPPVPPAAPAKPRSAEELLAQMGLRKKA